MKRGLDHRAMFPARAHLPVCVHFLVANLQTTIQLPVAICWPSKYLCLSNAKHNNNNNNIVIILERNGHSFSPSDGNKRSFLRYLMIQSPSFGQTQPGTLSKNSTIWPCLFFQPSRRAKQPDF